MEAINVIIMEALIMKVDKMIPIEEVISTHVIQVTIIPDLIHKETINIKTINRMMMVIKVTKMIDNHKGEVVVIVEIEVVTEEGDTVEEVVEEAEEVEDFVVEVEVEEEGVEEVEEMKCRMIVVLMNKCLLLEQLLRLQTKLDLLNVIKNLTQKIDKVLVYSHEK